MYLVPMTSPTSLDFTKLQSPPNHGDVLVVPEAAGWLAAARANAERLRSADTPLLGATLAGWRKRTREAVVGTDDGLVILTGHQPGFIHPGVWAKHVAASRFADAVGGVAVDFVVDSDAPKQTTIPIPSLEDRRVVLRHVRFADMPVGYAYEQIPRQTPEQIARFERATRDAMGDRYAVSLMPTFFEAKKLAKPARDWVDQVVAARRAVEAQFGIVLEDRRVSRCRGNPLLADMLLNGPRFSACYNRALASYRRTNRIRGTRHPIPDLVQLDDRYELPAWAQPAEGVRQRLFVARAGDLLRLFAGNTEIGALSASDISSGENLRTQIDGWRLWPRALTLTMWLRLLLADLFVHGIGGAKYDRISDAIMVDYYKITPPHLVCVSATLRLDLPGYATSPETVRQLQNAVRDLRFNPQRHLPSSSGLDDLMERRAVAICKAAELRQSDPHNHAARRAVYREIRDINAAFLNARPDAMSGKVEALERARDELRQNQIARGREYFFGLYDRHALEQLLDGLPAKRDFRV